MAAPRTRILPSTPPLSGAALVAAMQDVVDDLWSVAAIPLESIGGTANNITATAVPTILALVDGMQFGLIPTLANTNATVTLKLGALAAVNMFDEDGAALLVGALKAGRYYRVLVSGGVFRVLSAANVVRVTDYQSFTANGTWTKPAGIASNALVMVEMWGGGGGGGALARGAGGGGGGFIRAFYRAGQLGGSVSVIIGAGGSTNTVGGNTSFGTLVAYGGGAGGDNASADTIGGNGGGALQSGLSGRGDPTAGLGASAVLGADGYFGGGAGGGGVGTGSGTNGGRSVMGGGGGAGRGSTGTPIGGTSIFGGNGGAPSTPGTAPGGGGGGSAVGARGECRVLVLG